MSNTLKLTKTDLLYLVNQKLTLLRKYGLGLFLIIVALLYGFTLYRINMLGNAQPSPAAVDNALQAANIPRLDSAAVKKLQQLQTNTLNTQTPPSNVRSNPFECTPNSSGQCTN